MYPFVITLFYLTNLSSAASAHRRQFEDVPVRGDYASLLKNHVTWNKLPVTIYFVPDAEYTGAREKAARKGIDLWVQATDGFVGYKVVDDPDHAQITVRFDPTNDDGHTTTSYTSRRIMHARITMGVEQGSERDLECTAAHEFGHALGLSGHSSQSRDLMYPMHVMGRAWSITRRDLNTLALLYHIDPDVAAAWTPQNSGLYRYAPRRYRRQENSDGDYPGAAG
ncbi:MAG: repeat protein [Chthonomonadaceae bacterium]|nr:repeat protein [Chthonomonadaceae bacterium]